MKKEINKEEQLLKTLKSMVGKKKKIITSAPDIQKAAEKKGYQISVPYIRFAIRMLLVKGEIKSSNSLYQKGVIGARMEITL